MLELNILEGFKLFGDFFADGYNVPIWEQLLRVLLATVLGAVFGLERELKNKPAGFITFMLVSMGSCLFALLQVNMVAINNVDGIHQSVDTSRIIAQVVSGIGFLGAGTILHNRGTVKGITTAALLWVSAAVGLLIGMGGLNNYIIALAATVIFFPLSLLSRRIGRNFVGRHRVYRIYITFDEEHERELYDILAQNGAIVKKTFFHNKYVHENAQIKEVYVYFGVAPKKQYIDIIDSISTEKWVISVEDA